MDSKDNNNFQVYCSPGILEFLAEINDPETSGNEINRAEYQEMLLRKIDQ